MKPSAAAVLTIGFFDDLAAGRGRIFRSLGLFGLLMKQRQMCRLPAAARTVWGEKEFIVCEQV